MNIKEAVNTLHGLIDDIHFALSEGGDKEYADDVYEMEKTISEYVENHEMPFIPGLTITASTNDELPITEYVPLKRGQWVLGHVEPGYFTPGGNRPWICSECGQVISWRLDKPKENYCPNCGAKMEV